MIKFDFKIRQKEHAAVPEQVDKQKNWIVLFPETASAARSRQDRFVYLDLLIARQGLPEAIKSGTEVYVTDLPNAIGSRVAYACIKPDLKSFDLLTLARKLVEVHIHAKATSIAIDISGFAARYRHRLGEAMVAAAATASVEMPSFKSKRKQDPLPHQLEIYGHVEQDAYRRTLAEAEGNALCRHLSILPPNKLTPTEYLATVKTLSKQH